MMHIPNILGASVISATTLNISSIEYSVDINTQMPTLSAGTIDTKHIVESNAEFKIPSHLMAKPSILTERNKAISEDDVSDKISPQAYIDSRFLVYEKSIDNTISRIEKKLDTEIAQFRETSKEGVKEIKADNKTTRYAIAGLAATILFGIAGLNYTLTQNMMGSFGMGLQSRETIQNEVSTQNQSLTAKTDELTVKTNELALKTDELTVKTDILGNKLDKIAEKLDSLSIQNR